MIRVITPNNWKLMAQDVHACVHGTLRDPNMDRVDFVLLGVDDKDEMAGYITVKVFDDASVYFGWGGMFPSYKGTTKTYHIYKEAILFIFTQFKRINTYIRNTNVAMLKLAMKVGFLITGIKVIDNIIYCDLLLEEASYGGTKL